MLARASRPRAAQFTRRWLTSGDGDGDFLTSSARVLMLANLHRKSLAARDLKDYGESLAMMEQSRSDSGAHQAHIRGLISRSLADLGENDAAQAFASSLAQSITPAKDTHTAVEAVEEPLTAGFVFELHSPSKSMATRWFPVGTKKKQK